MLSLRANFRKSCSKALCNKVYRKIEIEFGFSSFPDIHNLGKPRIVTVPDISKALTHELSVSSMEQEEMKD